MGAASTICDHVCQICLPIPCRSLHDEFGNRNPNRRCVSSATAVLAQQAPLLCAAALILGEFCCCCCGGGGGGGGGFGIVIGTGNGGC